MSYDPDLAARKAAYLAEQAATAPRDTAAEIDHERELELRAQLTNRGRGYLTPEERDEVARIRERQNERAKERLVAQRAAEAKERAAQDEVKQRAAVEAEQARVRPLLRASFSGTDAEFNEKWPALWTRHRDRQALDAASAGYDALLEQKRRQLRDTI
jgi:hypothetical protein